MKSLVVAVLLAVAATLVTDAIADLADVVGPVIAKVSELRLTDLFRSVTSS